MELESESNGSSDTDERFNEAPNDLEFVSACNLIQKILAVSEVENSMSDEIAENNSLEENDNESPGKNYGKTPEENYVNSEEHDIENLEGNEVKTSEKMDWESPEEIDDKTLEENDVESLEENDSKNSEGNDSKNPEENDVESLKENDVENSEEQYRKYPEGNSDKTLEENDVQSLEENDNENPVVKTSEKNDKGSPEGNEGNTQGKNDRKSQEENGGKTPEEDVVLYIDDLIHPFNDSEEETTSEIVTTFFVKGNELNDVERERNEASNDWSSQEFEKNEPELASNTFQVQELPNRSSDKDQENENSLYVSKGVFKCRVCYFETPAYRLYKMHIQKHTIEMEGTSPIGINNEKILSNSGEAEDFEQLTSKTSKVSHVHDRHCGCNLNNTKLKENECSERQLRIQLFDVKHSENKMYNEVLNRFNCNGEKSLEEMERENECSTSFFSLSNKIGNNDKDTSYKHSLSSSTPIKYKKKSEINDTTVKATSLPMKNFTTQKMEINMNGHPENEINENIDLSNMFADDKDNNEEFFGFNKRVLNTSLKNSMANKKECNNRSFDKSEKTSRIFYCSACNFWCNRNYNLKTHMIKVHKLKALYQCEKCRIYKHTKKGLEQHECKFGNPLNEGPSSTSHLNDNIIKSKSINEGNKIVSEKTDKMSPSTTRKSMMNEKNKYYCDKCSFSSHFNCNIKVHKNIRHDIKTDIKSVPTNIIKKGKTNKTCLTNKNNNLHRLYYCCVCNYVSKYNQNVKLHMLRRHSIKDFYLCKKCRHYKHTHIELKEHEKECNTRPEETKFSFLLNKKKEPKEEDRSLTFSESSKSENVTRLKASQTNNRSSISKKKQLEKNKNEDSFSSNEENCKKFKCSFCSYSEKSSFFVKRHILTHTDLRLYKCKYCDFKSNIKKTIRNHYLRYHISNIINNSSQEDQGDVENVLSELCKVDRGAFNIASLYIETRTAEHETLPGCIEEEVGENPSHLSGVSTLKKRKASFEKLKPRKKFRGMEKNEKNADIGNTVVAKNQIIELGSNGYISNKGIYPILKNQVDQKKHKKKSDFEHLNNYESSENGREPDTSNLSENRSEALVDGVKGYPGEYGCGNNDITLENKDNNGLCKRKPVKRNSSYSYILSKYLEDTEPIDPIKCETCEFKARSVSVFKRHICKSKVTDESAENLSSEGRQNLEVEEMLKCEHCEFTTRSDRSYSRHKCKSETFSKPLQNVLSPKSKQRQDYNQIDDHVTKCTEKYNEINKDSLKSKNPEEKVSFKCNSCEFMAAHESDLITHNCNAEVIKKDVPDIQVFDLKKSYKCDHCEFKALSKRVLKMHKCNLQSIDQFHNVPINNVKKLELDNSAEFDYSESANKPTNILKRYKCRAKPFKCKYCNFATNKIILLMEHSGTSHCNDESLHTLYKTPNKFKINLTPKVEKLSDHVNLGEDSIVENNSKKLSIVETPKKNKNHLLVVKQELEESPMAANISNDNNVDMQIKEEDTTKLKCPFCSYESNNKRYLKRHLKRMHFKSVFDRTKKKENISPKKKEKISNKNEKLLTKKKDKISPKKNVGSKVNNLKKQNKDAKLLKCKYCNYKTKHLFNYNRHLKTQHIEMQNRKEKASLKNKLNNFVQNFNHKNSKLNGKKNNIKVQEDTKTISSKLNINNNNKTKVGNKLSLVDKAKLSKFSKHKKTVENKREVQVNNTKARAPIPSKQNLLHGKHSVGGVEFPQNKQEINLNKKCYRCTKCTFESYFLKSLTRHMKTHSTEDHPLFKCSKCSFNTGKRTMFEKHQLNCKDLSATKVINSEKAGNMKKNDQKTELSKSKGTSHNSPKNNKKTELSGSNNLGNLPKENKNDTKNLGNMPNENKNNTEKTESSSSNSVKVKNDKKSISKSQNDNSKAVLGRPKTVEISEILKTNPNVRIFDCLTCKYETIYRSALSYHMTSQKHKGNLYHCNLCRFKIYEKAKLEKHKAMSHKSNLILRCPSCDFVTSWKGALKTHQKHFHP